MLNQVPDLSALQLTELLKNSKLKNTNARKELLETIFLFDKPFTTEDVIKEIQKKGSKVHRATVYRDLQLFSEAGILRELIFQGATAHFYELPTAAHHHHFVCQNCFTIVDVIPIRVEKNLKLFERELESQGLHISHHHLKFYGLCSKCYQIKKG